MVYQAEHRFVEGEEDPLCSCEYMKPAEIGGGKGHLLDVMDEMEVIDECLQHGCVASSPVAAKAATIFAAKVRIPWIGGSKVVPSKRLPLVAAPLLLYLGAQERAWLNVLQAATTGCILLGAMFFVPHIRESPDRGRAPDQAKRPCGWSKPESGWLGSFMPCWLLADHALTFAAFVHELAAALSLGSRVAVTLSFAAMVALHMTVRCADPGILHTESVAQRTDIEGSHGERPFCEVCGLVRPNRAKHCRLCDVCVAGFDHHCPALDSCIGERNHTSFVAYLAVACANAVAVLAAVDAAECTHATCPWASAAAARTGLWLLATGPLLLTQLFNVATGLTTNERLNRGKPHYEYVDALPRRAALAHCGLFFCGPSGPDSRDAGASAKRAAASVSAEGQAHPNERRGHRRAHT